jgi:hypothetical protein
MFAQGLLTDSKYSREDCFEETDRFAAMIGDRCQCLSSLQTSNILGFFLIKLDKKPFTTDGRLLTCARWDHLEFIKDVI